MTVHLLWLSSSTSFPDVAEEARLGAWTDGHDSGTHRRAGRLSPANLACFTGRTHTAKGLGRSWQQPVLFVAGLAVYVVTGWLLLTQLFTGTEAAPARQQPVPNPGAGVTIRIKVIDGPTLSCATSAARAAGDTVIVSASALPDLFRKLDCWDPGDT